MPGVGAAFQCRRCGACCRRPGAVRLAPGDTAALAAYLGLSVPTFTAAWTTLSADRQGLQLRDRPDGACIFLDEDPPRCRVQPAKPVQCRTFPEGWRYEELASICAAAQAGWLPPPAATG